MATSSAPASAPAAAPATAAQPAPPSPPSRPHSPSPSHVGVSPDLLRERSSVSFRVEDVTNVLYQGATNAARRRYLYDLVGDDPVLGKRHTVHDESRRESYARGVRKSVRYFELLRDNNIVDDFERYQIRYAIDEMLPISLHHSMFIPTIEGQGSDEQRAKWLPLAKNLGIIGAYAQTELGHGSFVRGLETTATFDAATDEFVLHSPTLTSTKWWPGNMGKTANHVVLMARLITGAKDCGVHAFIMQIRDLDTHQPLRGITVGDIGPKFAYEMNDNGYLRFDHVRIPRANMLMRFATLSRKGEYKPSPNAKLAYGTMVYIRSWLVVEGALSLARAATVAVRYSCIRRQFPPARSSGGSSSSTSKGGKDGKGGANSAQPTATLDEVVVLNYQTQQHLLLPLVATAYAMHFTGRFMIKLLADTTASVARGDISGLKEVHVNSSGLKALTTQLATDGIETCRKACGGHGYSRHSGLIDLFANHVPACTYEGDNTIMYLQCASDLLKTLFHAQGFGRKDGKAKAPSGLLAYYTNIRAVVKRRCEVKQVSDWFDAEHLLAAFQHRAALQIATAAKLVFDEMSQGKPLAAAIELFKIDLVRAARAHCYHVILVHFVNAVRADSSVLAQANVSPSSPARGALLKLCALFGVHTLDAQLGEFNEDQYMTHAQVLLVRRTLHQLLRDVRPDAVGLVDAWDFNDHLLNSALGRFDGRVYETMWEWANTGNPMNAEQVNPDFAATLLPFVKARRERVLAEQQSARRAKL